MQYSTATPGRIFTVRLEDGDIVHECLEGLARTERIGAAAVILVGGADEGSRLVTGPAASRAVPIVPVTSVLDGVHEAAGVGTIFPDAQGEPKLHLHAACGRGTDTVTGCIRAGMKTWHVLEAVVIELCGSPAVRRHDPVTGFELLQPRG